jgi:PAS domain S-box-containing protein
MTISINGKITDVNIAAEQITGVTRDKLIGSMFMDHFTEPEKAREGYRTVFKEGLVRDYPLTMVHAEAGQRDVLFNATLFEDASGMIKGVFAVARDITDRKRSEVELRKSKELLEKLNRHLIDVRENERKQIALTLHDDLGQRLTGLYLNIAWLKNRSGKQTDDVKAKLDEISTMVNDTIESIKETSSFLRPDMLYELGLIPAINSQLKKFEKQSDIKCIFNCDPDLKIDDDQLSLTLFRILQESLTNIARHSGASRAEVSLHRVKDEIEMTVRDNGIGITKENINSMKAMGIAGMKERVRGVKGSLHINAESGVGTSININIPVNKSKKR